MSSTVLSFLSIMSLRRFLLVFLILGFVSGTALAASSKSGPKRVKPAVMSTVQGEDVPPPPAPDLDEGQPLPPYPPGARMSVGKMKIWTVGEEDTLLDVARYFGLGYTEMRAANPDIDAWIPLPGSEMMIPTFHLLPRAPQEGVVVNLAEMRLYYFRTPGGVPDTMPIGIGRDGLLTPTGETKIVNKAAYPVWRPTARMRAEQPFLPEAVPAGPMNPLGTHALYLGWPEFRIHGSNKPWAIGRRVSSGCLRLYPEDIIRLFNAVPVGTRVTVVEQPILVTWIGRKLWMEAIPSRRQSSQLEIDDSFAPKDLTPALKKVIIAASGKKGAAAIDWSQVEKTVHERRGYPVMIADLDAWDKQQPGPPLPAKLMGPQRPKPVYGPWQQ